MKRSCLALAIAVAIGSTLFARQTTFSTRVETVRVDVRVTDRGRVVTGLRPEDFDVLDSGVRQTVEFLRLENLSLNIVLAIDGSASVAGGRLEHLREAGHALLENTRKGDQVALLTFTDAVVLRERLTSDAARVGESLDRVEADDNLGSGGTALIDAVQAALTLSDRDIGRSLVLVFTDGVDTSSWLSTQRVVAAAQRSDAVVYVVTAARQRKDEFTRGICEATGGEAFEITSPAALRSTFLQVLEDFRQRYLVSFTPTGVPAGGWHPLSVKVKGRNLTVKARPGYAR
jgi:VWFA-related protein